MSIILFSAFAVMALALLAMARTNKALSFAKIAAPAALLVLPFQAEAAPDSDLWSFWDKADNSSTAVIDHTAWQEILDGYLKPAPDGINKFDYAGLQFGDQAKLEGYINALTSIDPRTYNKKEQMAYWINLYNALTIKVILDHYPVKSILKIDTSPGLFNFGPWDQELLVIAGENITLNDIEHRILRPIWKTPLIHYAVNCASIGCPNLNAKAFTGENLDELLLEGAVDYINHPRGVNVKGRRVEVSKIFDWYESDFGDNDAEVLDHIREYASDELLGQLEGRTRISDYEYDWDLNETK